MAGFGAISPLRPVMAKDPFPPNRAIPTCAGKVRNRAEEAFAAGRLRIRFGVVCGHSATLLHGRGKGVADVLQNDQPTRYSTAPSAAEHSFPRHAAVPTVDARAIWGQSARQQHSFWSVRRSRSPGVRSDLPLRFGEVGLSWHDAIGSTINSLGGVGIFVAAL
jgi:hypothetical protein